MRRVLGILWVLVGVIASQAQPVPDFSLQDVNFRSPRYSKWVSPRDYRLQVSGYFFGGFG
jgi:hypothetical protein